MKKLMMAIVAVVVVLAGVMAFGDLLLTEPIVTPPAEKITFTRVILDPINKVIQVGYVLKDAEGNVIRGETLTVANWTDDDGVEHKDYTDFIIQAVNPKKSLGMNLKRAILYEIKRIHAGTVE